VLQHGVHIWYSLYCSPPDLRHGIRARLEDDQEHPQGPALLLQGEPVRQLRARQGLADEVRHARRGTNALRQLLYLHIRSSSKEQQYGKGTK